MYDNNSCIYLFEINNYDLIVGYSWTSRWFTIFFSSFIGKLLQEGKFWSCACVNNVFNSIWIKGRHQNKIKQSHDVSNNFHDIKQFSFLIYLDLGILSEQGIPKTSQSLYVTNSYLRSTICLQDRVSRHKEWRILFRRENGRSSWSPVGRPYLFAI